MDKELHKKRIEVLEGALRQIYGEAALDGQKRRYQDLCESFSSHFGATEMEFFSAPGRTEICGNHTDHNGGKVLAGSIDMDCIAAAARQDKNEVVIISETYQQEIIIDLSDLPNPGEVSGTEALITGIIRGFLDRGYLVGGFQMYTTTDVIGAAGVSSSASFEMLLCSVIDCLYNDCRAGVIVYAIIGKEAENIYWNKDSGMLDQIACGWGGLVEIDFADEHSPQITPCDVSFREYGYELLIVNTGKSHADLSEEYSSIPIEMKRAASFFNKSSLAQVSEKEVIRQSRAVRAHAGDRAFLRALHYFEENRRVTKAVDYLQQNDFPSFLQMIRESGLSSWKYLQNCALNGTEQPVSAALALTELFLNEGSKGICRVHGGGFAGVILVVIKSESKKEYIEYISPLLGQDNIYEVKVRRHGVTHLTF